MGWSTAYNYEYTLRDHLGNSRVSFDVATGKARAVQKDDYLPFGLDVQTLSNGTPNKYLYNNKELQDGLALYDYGARFYDPVIGRWTVEDQMAGKSPSLTPYRYAFNNPIRVVDPNGMYEEDGHYWTVYLMLTLMGNKDASNIAFWTEWPDLKMLPSGDSGGK